MDWENGIREGKTRYMQGLGVVIWRKKITGITSHRWKNSIKRGSKEIGRLDFDWIDLTENRGN